jgi:WD40 repeat protein
MLRSSGLLTRTLALTLACVLGAFASVLADEKKTTEVDPNAPVSFFKQVLPILQHKCQGCHQPAKANAKLDLTSFESLAKGGDSGAAIEPGKPDESVLVENVTGSPPTMPPMGVAMTPEEVTLVTRWVTQGAKDDTPPQAKDTIDAEHPPVYAAAPLTTALAFSPDGQTLAISGYREILIYKADGSALVNRLVGQSQRIESLTFSPDGSVLASVGGSPGRFGEVQFWDAKTYKLRTALRSTYDTLYGGAFTPDGKRFAFGCADNSARMVDVKDGKEVLRIDHHSDWVFGTTFSLDGKHLITLGRDGALKLTESDTGSFIDDIGKNYGELKVLARHPKENRVVIGGDERIPRLYQIFRTRARDMNYTDFNLLRAFEAQPGPISALAFSPDGNTIAVGGTGGEVQVYNVADGAHKQTFKGHAGGVYAIAYSTDSTRVATGGFDGNVRVFDAASGKLVASFVPVPVAGTSAVAQVNAELP